MPLLTADPALPILLWLVYGACVVGLASALIWSCIKCWKDRDHE